MNCAFCNKPVESEGRCISCDDIRISLSVLCIKHEPEVMFKILQHKMKSIQIAHQVKQGVAPQTTDKPQPWHAI